MATDTAPTDSAPPAGSVGSVKDSVDSIEDQRRDLPDRRGWLAIAAITAIVAATWIPALFLPMGDNQVGRILGRHALHLRSFRTDGLLGSSFTAEWAPYATGAYAHHPPLQNILDVVFGWSVADGVVAVQTGPALLGLLTIPAAAALLRAFGIRWRSTLLAVGLLVATAFFWVYGPVLFDLAPILALSAIIVHLRERRDPPRWLIVLACGASLVATLASWPAIAVSAALGLWLFAKRRLDRITIAVGTSMIIGVALSLLFIVGITGIDKLTNQTTMRTTGGAFTAVEFVLRQGRYAIDLLPVWYLILLPVAVAVGIADRRTRLYVAGSTLFSAGWVIVLNNGAFIHTFWAYPVLIPGLVGMGVLADRLQDRMTPKTFTGVTATLSLLLTVWFAVMVFGPTGQDRVYRPADAGTLVIDHPPPSGQRYAWTTLSTPRWLVYYWNLPPRELTQQALLDDTRPDELVVVRLDELPAWLPPSVSSKAIATQGRYGLLRAADLQQAMHRG